MALPQAPGPPLPPPRTTPPPPSLTSLQTQSVHRAPLAAVHTGARHQRARTVSAAKAAAQAAVQEVHQSPSHETRHDSEIAASTASAAAVNTSKNNAPAAAPSPWRATRGGSGTLRKPRLSLTIDDKLKMVFCMKQTRAYKTWADQKEAFPNQSSEKAIQDAWRQRQTLRKRSREEPGSTRRLRPFTFLDVDRELKRWYSICAGLGMTSLPLTMVLLRQRAENISSRLRVTGFYASKRLMRQRAKRQNLVNICLWGAGGSSTADVESSRHRMAEIRKQLFNV